MKKNTLEITHMLFKKDFNHIMELTFSELESLHYPEQFLEIAPVFFVKHLPISRISLFFLNHEKSTFIDYLDEKYKGIRIQPVTPNSNLAVYLKNNKKTILLKDEKPSIIEFLKKTNPDLFQLLVVDLIIPMLSLGKLHGFMVIEAPKTIYKELEYIEGFFKIFSNIIIPLIISERIHIESDKNYYKIYRMDRLAMVGELAASAAHEIKNPLAGISTYLKYFMELENFNKKDIIDELATMKQSVHRIDEIVKSLLSFSRYTKKKIHEFSLTEVIEASLNSIRLKIPSNIQIIKKFDDSLSVKTDFQQLQQVIINIIFNAVEAIGKKEGEITIQTYISGRDRLPSHEMYNIYIKDTGPGIPEEFIEKLFQPFQTTKEDGTGLGLYTCYGLMKSMGGTVKINSPGIGTEAVISFPFSFEDDDA